MHENENFAKNISLVKIPCMKLYTTQLPMNISWAKNHARVEIFIFIFIATIFSCMKICVRVQLINAAVTTFI